MMSWDAEQIAREFDRTYLDPATERLQGEGERLRVIRQDMEALVERKRKLAEQMRATISEIENEREAITAALTDYRRVLITTSSVSG